MIVKVYEYDGGEIEYEALDAVLVAESVLRIVLNEREVLTIHGYWKYSTTLSDDEYEILQAEMKKEEEYLKAQEAEARARSLGSKFSLPSTI